MMTDEEFAAAYREVRQAQIAEEREADRASLLEYQAECLRSWEGRTEHNEER